MNFDDEDFPRGDSLGGYDYFDWYDQDKVEKLNQSRAKQWIKLYAKLKEAKKNGEEKALIKAREAFRKHEAETRDLKAKATEAGTYWY
jgi:hypothetical protein